ncbi:basement membrane-specific heparan sulfate proteoglycan core protein isoform X30 [Schistocerca gregaria]|uniref:basement membrane-specific heparan sulfate proteoglycan core protein isoform X30 n=1 Tax=Schistocerca gregaria TaxID=7010 RepID=UPI00211DE0F6|nr:basement membrane-specific heparan sulfate proteoglycan core protein isoform X30 [Schistocerca gregaria]
MGGAPSPTMLSATTTTTISTTVPVVLLLVSAACLSPISAQVDNDLVFDEPGAEAARPHAAPLLQRPQHHHGHQQHHHQADNHSSTPAPGIPAPAATRESFVVAPFSQLEDDFQEAELARDATAHAETSAAGFGDLLQRAKRHILDWWHGAEPSHHKEAPHSRVRRQDDDYGNEDDYDDNYNGPDDENGNYDQNGDNGNGDNGYGPENGEEDVPIPGDNDDEDLYELGPHSGSGAGSHGIGIASPTTTSPEHAPAEPQPPGSPRYYRMTLVLLEPYHEDMANRSSSRFEDLSRQLVDFVQRLYEDLPGEQRAMLIRLQPNGDPFKSVATLDIGTRYFYDAEQIRQRIYDHIRNYRSLDNIPATVEGFTFKEFSGQNGARPTACAPNELPCRSGECLPASTRCNGRQECEDGSDEAGCPPPAVTECAVGEFLCDLSRCILASQRCDGVRDCDDGTDEHECPTQACDPRTQWQCNMGECIDQRLVCDGKRDCPRDGSDEENCLTCLPSEFKCQDQSRCIDQSLRCDGRYDCPDGSDEGDLCTEPSPPDSGSATTCAPSQFTCRDGTCIEASRHCDRTFDCPDYSDEERCEGVCVPGEFPCADGSQCVPEYQRCDGRRNCRDGSDEEDCEGCADNQFECNDGTCIDLARQCNGFPECRDGSDEFNCPDTDFDPEVPGGGYTTGREPDFSRSPDSTEYPTGAPPVDEEECTAEQFRCSNGLCISDTFRCDGYPDCIDGSDETGCPRRECAVSEFRCRDGTCIPLGRRCDGRTDCSDFSDEYDCPTPAPTCSALEFTCGDGSCIDRRRVCDGRPDCRDYSDERDCACRPGEFRCRDGQCVPDYQRCDGVAQCRDSSDEYGCPPRPPPPTPPSGNCLPGQFACASGGQCVPQSSVCNGRPDCRDRSDERDCPAVPTVGGLNLKTYPDDQIIKESREVVFQCRDEGPLRARVHWLRANNQPLPPGSRDVNGRLEMPEIQLEHSGTYICEAIGYYPSTPGARAYVTLTVEQLDLPVTRPAYTCQPYEATCANLDCIPKEKVCDGNFDCVDGSDEMRCSAHGCEPNEFQCDNKRCVLKTWRCDSDDDCGDGSDEQNCATNPPGSPCRYNEFQCRSGDQCIPKSFQCDLEVDCQDRSDEIGCSPVYIQTPPPPMVNLNIGDTMNISCTAIGVPTPEVVWRLNWGHIPAKCTTRSVNGVGTLICPDIQETDQGAYSCEAINTRGPVFAVPDAILVVNRPPSVCQRGYFNDLAYRPSDCIPCFCFGVTSDCSSADLFTYQLPPPLDATTLVGVRIDPQTGAVSISPQLPRSRPGIRPLDRARGSFQVYSVERTSDGIYPYFAMPENYLGNQLKSYGGYLKYTVNFVGQGRPNNAPEVILSGNNYTLVHVPRQQPEAGRDNDMSVRFFYGEWYKRTGARPGGDIPGGPTDVLASREEIMMALSNVDNILIKTQHTDGGLLSTTLSNIHMDSAAIRNTGQGQAAFVEECRCPPGYAGLSCERCAEGYEHRPQGPWLGVCVPSAPPTPQSCRPGEYGDPQRGIPCQPCPCPLTSPGNQFGRSCFLDTDGQVTCDCPPGYVGRRCERCDVGYTGNPLIPGDSCSPGGPCDPAGSLSTEVDPVTGQCRCKELTTGTLCNQCKPNSFHLAPQNPEGCISCFCMGITDSCTSSSWYRTQITSAFTRDAQDFKLVDDPLNLDRPITEGLRVDPVARELVFQDFSRRSPVVYYWMLPPQFLGDKVTSYGGYLNYTVRYVPAPGGQSSRNNAPDVELISSNDIKLMYFGRDQIEADRPQTVSVPLLEQYWQRNDGQQTHRDHIMMALADVQAILVKATYTTNTREAALIQVTMDIAEERNTGQQRAFPVEECACPVGYRGLSCEDCDAGYTRSFEGLYLGLCEPCNCNGHSDECHPEEGTCYNCRDHTTGPNCEQCEPGYEGDATRGTAADCRPTGDRPPTSDTCYCDPRGSRGPDCPCVCKTNVEGEQCNLCRRGTFSLSEDHVEGCLECFCNGVSETCQASNLYRQQIPMQVFDENHGFTLADNNRQTIIRDGFTVNMARNEIEHRVSGAEQRLFWSLPPSFTGNKLESYGGYLNITQSYSAQPNSRRYYDTDIVIVGNGISIYWSGVPDTRPDVPFTYSVQLKEGVWQRLLPTGPGPASRQDMLRVLSAVEAILVRAFHATLTTATRISDISLDTAVPQPTGQAAVRDVEVCRCPPGYRGSSCESCSPGYYRDTSRGPESATCVRCPCNGNEESCYADRDGRVTCVCQPGYTGRYCDSTERPPIVTPSPLPGSTDSPQPTITVRISEPSIQIVEAGSTVRYRCTGVSIYEVPVSLVWTKEGGELPDRAYDDRRGTLTITSVVPSDSGTYICTASDQYSIQTSRAVLTVGGSGSEPPRVEVRPQYLTVNEGDSAEFECSASGIPQPDIRWTPDEGRQLSPQVYYSGGVLRIPSVRKSDEGRYTCSASNPAGEDRRTVYLYVSDSPEPSVQLTMQPSTYDGPEGATVVLRCLAGGVAGAPPPRITWSRQGAELPPNARQEDDGRGSATLEIPSATAADSGVYICTAVRTTPPSYTTSTVRVVVTAYRQPPVVSIEPERQTVAQGSLAELRCVASGEPTPAITWSKANEELSSSSQAVGPVLRIPNIQVQDRGIYICTAESPSGTSQASAVLEVERRESPRVSLFPTEQQTVITGGSILLQCRVEAGIPAPTVTWSRVDGRPLPSSVEELPGGVLRFTGMTKDDEGTYLCVARNEAGEARLTGSISVHTPPHITLLPSQQVSVNAGQNIRLECRATGDPLPNVFWQTIQRPFAVESMARPSVAILEINGASRADEGSYSCLAQNAAGSAEERLYLTVVDAGAGVYPPGNDTYYPPYPRPTRPYSTEPPFGQETGAESEGGVKEPTPRPGYPQYPGLTVSSQRFELPVGGSGDLRCSLSGRDPQIDRIFLRWIRPDNRQLPRNSYERDGILGLRNVQYGDEGEYICQGVSPTGQTVFSASTYVELIELPRIRLEPEHQVVRPGDSARIECSVVGTPPIDIRWQAVGRGLPPSVTTSGGVLQFQGITVADTGRYICLATNRYGQAEGAAEVIVEDYESRPPVTSPVQRDQTANVGSRVELQCRVSQIADRGASYSWTRYDRRPLPPTSTRRGDTLVLNDVRPEDSGRYVCTVTEAYPGNRQFSEYIDLRVELYAAGGCYFAPPGVSGVAAVGGFQCRTGECVPLTAQCDGRIDCRDGSDELYCGGGPAGYRRGGRGVSSLSLHIDASSQQVRAGDNVDLRCRVSGADGSVPVNFRWTKEDRDRQLDGNVQTASELLRITNVRPENGGVYRCTAYTGAGTFSEDYVLTIQDIPDPMNDDAAAIETLTAEYGSTVSMECKTDLEPPVNYRWSRQGGDLPDKAEERQEWLQIREVTGRDAGTYTCTADNGNLRMDIPKVLVVTGVVPYFSQEPNAYTKLPTLSQAYVGFDVSVSFRPDSPDGMILYNGEKSGDEGDFISLGLVDGRVEFRFNVGSGPAVITSRDRIRLGEWHTVRIVRDKKRGSLYVDNQEAVTGETTGLFQGLDLKEPLFIGGVPDYRQISSQSGFTRGFKGCVSRLVLSAASQPVDLMREAIESEGVTACDACSHSPCSNGGVCQEAADSPRGFTCLCTPGFSGTLCDRYGEACYPDACGPGRCHVDDERGLICFCPFGRTGPRCEREVSVRTPMFNGEAYLAYTTPARATSKLIVSIKFRPDDLNDGIIAYSGQSTDGRGDFFAIVIHNRTVEFRYDTGAGLKVLRSRHRLVAGEWTSLTARRDYKEASLTVADDRQTRLESAGGRGAANRGLNLRTPLFLGGVNWAAITVSQNAAVTRGFVGCISELKVSGRTVDLVNALVEAANVEECVDRTPPPTASDEGFGPTAVGGCRGDMNPCQNSARCIEVPGSGRYYCECPPGYTGTNCETALQDQEDALCRSLRPCQNGGSCETRGSTYHCHCPIGWTGTNCQQAADFETEAGFQGDGWVELPGRLMPHSDPHQQEQLTVEFSTTQPDGILFWHGQEPEASGRGQDYLALAVVNGSLELSYELGSGPARIRYPLRVDDGRTHTAVAERQATQGSLSVDNGTPEYGESGGLRAMLNTDGSIYVGGLPNPSLMTDGRYLSGLTGCVHAIYIDEDTAPLYLRELAIGGRNVRSCDSGSEIDNDLFGRRQRRLTAGHRRGKGRRQSGRKA